LSYGLISNYRSSKQILSESSQKSIATISSGDQQDAATGCIKAKKNLQRSAGDFDFQKRNLLRFCSGANYVVVFTVNLPSFTILTQKKSAGNLFANFIVPLNRPVTNIKSMTV